MRGHNQLYLWIFTALLLAMMSSPSLADSGGSGAGGLLWLLLGGGAAAGAAAAGAQQVANAKQTRRALRSRIRQISEGDGDALAEPEQDACVTVFAPGVAKPGANILVQIILHVPDSESDARAIALKADPGSSELASSPLALPLKRHDLIKVSLEADGAGIAEPVQSLHWNGILISFPFEVGLPDLEENTLMRFKARVSANGVPAGTTYFNVTLGTVIRPVALAQQAQAYRRPFLSYASQDRAQVLRAAQVMRALKMDFFQDLLTLDPGEQWQPRLFSEIDQCDIFLLFWSTNARESRWVRNETEYALRRSRLNSIEIVPVLLEGPPAPLPPPSLEEIHFNDALQYIIFAEESSAKARFKWRVRRQWITSNLFNNYMYIPLLILACLLLAALLPR